MTAHRVLLLTALIALVLIVSCSTPAAPTVAPTRPAPTVASPTQLPAPTVAPTQAAAPTAAPTQPPAPTVAPTKPAATVAPTQTAAPTSAPTTAAAQPTAASSAQSGSTPEKLDMNAIFPPGAGRDAVLDNCVTCHTIVPLVILQYPQAQWDLSARNHRDRVPRMSDADFKAAYDYLAKNFNPDHPVPKLPKNLLDTWTDY